MGLTETVLRRCCPCCSERLIILALRMAFFVSALWMLVDWATDLQTLVVTYYPKCADPQEAGRPNECGYLYSSLASLASPSILHTLYLLMMRCRGAELSWRHLLMYGPLYFLSAPATVLGLALRAVCWYGGDERREIDQEKARVLKVFEHIGEALPQLCISLVFLHHEGTSRHPLTLLSSVVSLISLLIGLTTGTLALRRRGLTL